MATPIPQLIENLKIAAATAHQVINLQGDTPREERISALNHYKAAYRALMEHHSTLPQEQKEWLAATRKYINNELSNKLTVIGINPDGSPIEETPNSDDVVPLPADANDNDNNDDNEDEQHSVSVLPTEIYNEIYPEQNRGSAHTDLSAHGAAGSPHHPAASTTTGNFADNNNEEHLSSEERSRRQAAKIPALSVQIKPVTNIPLPIPTIKDGLGVESKPVSATPDAATSPTTKNQPQHALEVTGSAGSPSRAGLEGDQNPKQDGKSSIIATTGDIIDVVTKKGTTKVNIPRTEGMSHARRVEVAQNLVSAAMIHGAFTMKKNDNGVETPHFKIDTRDIVLRAALEAQLDLLGFTYNSVEPKTRNKEQYEYDKEYSRLGGLLPSRYESAIANAKRQVRESCAKSNPEYAAAAAEGNEQARKQILHDRTLQRAGFFDRFIAGAEQVNPNDNKLVEENKRRAIANQVFFPNAQNAAKLFAESDKMGCCKAGDRDGRGRYIYLKENETPNERLDKIAKLGIGEGNGWEKPDAIKEMTGHEFAMKPSAALQAMIGKTASATPAASREEPRAPGP